jgi:hypothetical protein
VRSFPVDPGDARDQPDCSGEHRQLIAAVYAVMIADD